MATDSNRIARHGLSSQTFVRTTRPHHRHPSQTPMAPKPPSSNRRTDCARSPAAPRSLYPQPSTSSHGRSSGAEICLRAVFRAPGGRIQNTGIRWVKAQSKYGNTEYGAPRLAQNTRIRNTVHISLRSQVARLPMARLPTARLPRRARLPTARLPTARLPTARLPTARVTARLPTTRLPTARLPRTQLAFPQLASPRLTSPQLASLARLASPQLASLAGLACPQLASLAGLASPHTPFFAFFDPSLLDDGCSCTQARRLPLLCPDCRVVQPRARACSSMVVRSWAGLAARGCSRCCSTC